jgi:hypothetical protein
MLFMKIIRWKGSTKNWIYFLVIRAIPTFAVEDDVPRNMQPSGGRNPGNPARMSSANMKSAKKPLESKSGKLPAKI